MTKGAYLCMSFRETLERWGVSVTVLAIIFCISIACLWKTDTAIGRESEYMVGVYYFTGFTSDKESQEVQYFKRGYDWRIEFPEREPIVGWYSDSQEAMDTEIEMASNYGIKFFNFLWYAGMSERAKEDGGYKFPIDLFTTSRNKHMMKFCLSYVNHDKLGVGGKDEWLKAVDEWVEYFKDPQYLKIDGKPVFKIHGLHWMREQWGAPHVVKLRLDELRKRAMEEGFPGVLIGAGVNDPGPGGAAIADCIKEGYDWLSAYNDVPFHLYDRARIDYEEFIQRHKEIYISFLFNNRLPYVPFITAAWDPGPWRNMSKAHSFYVDKPTKDQFKDFLVMAKEIIDEHKEMRLPTEDGKGVKMITICAWNEYGEGSYINPSKEFGYSYLEAIKEVFE